MRKRKLVCVLASLSLIGAVVAGCGGDDDEDESSEESVEQVTLVADEAGGGEYTFDLSATPTADTTSVVYDNQGDQPHALIFARLGEGYTIEEAFELEGRKGSAVTFIEGGAKPGESQTYDLKDPLEPGEYAMLCPIGGNSPAAHWKNGQLEEFTIE